MSEGADIARQERIEAYVAARLSESDTRAFEAQLAQDDVLRADVEIERVLQQTQRRGSELRFRDLVRHVSAEQEQGVARGGGAETPVIPIGSGRWRWWAVAASVAVLVGVGSVLMLQGPGSEQLALAQVGSYTLQVRGDTTTVDPTAELLMRARRLILEQKAADAIPALQQPVEGACPDAERTWLLGVAYLLTGDETKARNELERAGKAGCSISRNATELLNEL